MKISNDIVSFDAADFDGLSDVAKKSLLAQSPNFQNDLAERINGDITHAVSQFLLTLRPNARAAGIIERIVAADDAKLDAVVAALDAVVAPGGGEQQAPAAEEGPGLIARVANFFKS